MKTLLIKCLVPSLELKKMNNIPFIWTSPIEAEGLLVNTRKEIPSWLHHTWATMSKLQSCIKLTSKSRKWLQRNEFCTRLFCSYDFLHATIQNNSICINNTWISEQLATMISTIIIILCQSFVSTVEQWLTQKKCITTSHQSLNLKYH
jgi:hypothetical protein